MSIRTYTTLAQVIYPPNPRTTLIDPVGQQWQWDNENKQYRNAAGVKYGWEKLLTERQSLKSLEDVEAIRARAKKIARYYRLEDYFNFDNWTDYELPSGKYLTWVIKQLIKIQEIYNNPGDNNPIHTLYEHYLQESKTTSLAKNNAYIAMRKELNSLMRQNLTPFITKEFLWHVFATNALLPMHTSYTSVTHFTPEALKGKWLYGKAD
ncbi:hypothetical protein R6G85_02485 [Actinotignum urinale]|uniref:hypothetical protein n=1 Tax=Actinotignum urinale TaxID=190146 RepID=UPI002A81707F|nr:hypothetical protein [Actinotignum urinale]MDY5151355.1 hypothetical protein [Actinotignum urinale]